MYVCVGRSVLRKGPRGVCGGGGGGGGPVASQSLCVNSYNRWALGQVVTFLTLLACGYASAALWHHRACFCRQPPVWGGVGGVGAVGGGGGGGGGGGQNLHWLLYGVIA